MKNLNNSTSLLLILSANLTFIWFKNAAINSFNLKFVPFSERYLMIHCCEGTIPFILLSNLNIPPIAASRINLIFASSENQEGLVGWQEAINIENYLYIANQNDEPILISKETLEIFSLRLGSKEPKKIASSLGDFIQTLSEIMALSEKFFSKNINNDDYFML